MWRLGPLGALTLLATAAVSSSWPSRPVAAPQPPPEPPPPAGLFVPPPPPPSHSDLGFAPSGPPTVDYRPTILPPVDRIPHRRSLSRPVPGGPFQVQAAREARLGHCAESLGVVYRAVERSVDYAPLFDEAWTCFDERHQEPLLEPRQFGLTRLQLEKLQTHFWGAQVPPPLGPEIPEWMREPVDGIEYRLQAFMGSSEHSALLREEMLDRRGPAQITDTIAQDVMLVLDAAQALADVPQPTLRTHMLWAHHVYWATRALDNPVISQLLRTHRPHQVPQFEERYERATTPPPGTDLPPEVQVAMQLAMTP